MSGQNVGPTFGPRSQYQERPRRFNFESYTFFDFHESNICSNRLKKKRAAADASEAQAEKQRQKMKTLQTKVRDGGKFTVSNMDNADEQHTNLHSIHTGVHDSFQAAYDALVSEAGQRCKTQLLALNTRKFESLPSMAESEIQIRKPRGSVDAASFPSFVELFEDHIQFIKVCDKDFGSHRADMAYMQKKLEEYGEDNKDTGDDLMAMASILEGARR